MLCFKVELRKIRKKVILKVLENNVLLKQIAFKLFGKIKIKFLNKTKNCFRKWILSFKVELRKTRKKKLFLKS
jgi:hypothetical protein